MLINKVSNNGITGLAPLKYGGISDENPFLHSLSTLKSGLEESTIHDD